METTAKDSTTLFALVVIRSINMVVQGLECYSCQNVTFMANCNAVTKCAPGSICYAEISTFAGDRRYTLGCKPDAACQPQPTKSLISSSIIGRSLQNEACSECCETGMCNRQMCQGSDPACTDTTDCTILGTHTNICTDVHHVKTICRRFCGLCSLADGGWSQWSMWSACDVTCDNGTRIRSRKCNDPEPVDGGKLCAGSNQDSELCTISLNCPVAGGWSQWSTWGSCSVTCDIGMQRRDRSCNSPYPTHAGDHCYGESRDDRLCQPGACKDGHWSSWGSWSSCTVTCGGGLRTRTRTCDNPAPSLAGSYCAGNQMQADTCGKTSCIVNVAFKATTPSQNYSAVGQRVTYIREVLNVGNGYNRSTGYFTAPEGGTYQFNVHICSQYRKYAAVTIVAMGQVIGSASNYDHDTETSCTSGSGLAVLAPGDKVSIKSVWKSYFSDIRWNSFSGFLIRS